MLLLEDREKKTHIIFDGSLDSVVVDLDDDDELLPSHDDDVDPPRSSAFSRRGSLSP